MEITEFEKKRAANLIWNGAEDYTIEPGFRVYDEDGRADVYWNSIVGAIHLHYDWEKLEEFYHTFHETVNQSVYESLFWLALENAVYQKEEKIRPVFPYLRKQYAKRAVEALHGSFSLEDSAGQRLLAIQLGHFRRALGLDANLPDAVDLKLLDAIEIGPDLTTKEVIEAISKTLSDFFTYRPPGTEDKNRKKSGRSIPRIILNNLAFWRKKADRPEKLQPLRRLAFGYGEHVSEYGTEVLDQSHLSVAFAKYAAQTDEGLREYIKTAFGKPLFSDEELKRLQKEYCFGNHTDAKLYLTDGSYTDEMLGKGYAGKMKKEAIRQEEENLSSFEKNSGLYRIQIEKLTSKIRNMIRMRLEDEELLTRSGTILPKRIWRGLYLNDPRIFTKTFRGDIGNLTVDILLDASTSQIHRQETVSAQGYMIAESLTRCGIPVRVSSFCSLNGYTILEIYRDYREAGGNRNIFRFHTSGANRDGLAVRLTAGFMKKNHADHRILIILSDGQPNDVLKVRTSDGTYEDYASSLAAEDTAAEVHAARLAGITVLCVFTGEDKSLEAVRKIYGRDFVRIRSFDMFADAVSKLLENQIRMF